MLITARPFLFSDTKQLTHFEEAPLGRDEHERRAPCKFFAEPRPNHPSSSISFVWRGFVLLVSSLYRAYVAERRRKGKAFKYFSLW